MRDHVTTALEIAGLAAIAGGCFLIAPAVGFIAVGLALLLVGTAEGSR